MIARTEPSIARIVDGPLNKCHVRDGGSFPIREPRSMGRAGGSRAIVSAEEDLYVHLLDVRSEFLKVSFLGS